MYIFRWLMKHPIIILAVYFLSIAAILYSMTGGSSDNTVDTANLAANKKVESADVDLTKAPEIEPSSLTSALVTGEPSKDVSNSDTVKSVTDTTSLESQDQFNEIDTDELLLMAREAYWNNGLEESAEIYQQLINSNPEVIDYKGELGNVYWRQGFPKKAAELYAEISMPMIANGEKDKVANMVGFIGLFFPEKATEIHNKLQSEK